MKHFKVQVELEATNTFRFQAVTKRRAEQIALDTARGHASNLESLSWDVKVRVAKRETKQE